MKRKEYEFAEEGRVYERKKEKKNESLKLLKMKLKLHGSPVFFGGDVFKRGPKCNIYFLTGKSLIIYLITRSLYSQNLGYD